jgi:hypothetical protein
MEGAHGMSIVSASHSELGGRFLYCKGAARLLFTENETNNQRLFGSANQTRYVKDGINEYFHGDNGAGLGASHQTGWTGLVATMIELFGRLDGPHFLEMGRTGAFAKNQAKGN